MRPSRGQSHHKSHRNLSLGGGRLSREEHRRLGFLARNGRAALTSTRNIRMGFDPVKEGVIELGRISGNFDVVTSRHRLQPEQESCVRQHGSSGTRTRIVCEAIRVVGRTAPVAVVAGGALKHQSGHRECHRQRKRKGGRRDGVTDTRVPPTKGKERRAKIVRTSRLATEPT